MTPLSERIKTVVLVMLENRSFDHMLGHLRYEGLIPGVNGLTPDLSGFANVYGGNQYLPYQMTAAPLSSDIPHEYDYVDIQLARNTVTGGFAMDGFVAAYAKYTGVEPIAQADPLGFFAAQHVPISSFLAQNFCVCDRWHASLPTSTQPNRTIAFCGGSEIYDTAARLIHAESMVFDWLSKNQIRWRVYHDGFSFFALYPRAWSHVLGDNFRDVEYYFHDMQKEPVGDGPQVVIVEPSYQDAPHIGPDHPNDNHPPLAIGWGEEFLRRVYQAATVNPERWRGTALIYYYDEHGGFFDHVPPPRIPYTTGGSPAHAFASLGPRVPAVIVSPFVDRGSVCNLLLDHTSVLQFLADVFTPGTPYNTNVSTRQAAGVGSIAAVLRDNARSDVPNAPAAPVAVTSVLGDGITSKPSNPMQEAFEIAAGQLLVAHPNEMGSKYPELFHWKAQIDAERRHV